MIRASLCSALLAVTIFAGSESHGFAKEKTYANAAYRIAFAVPASWTIRTDEEGYGNRRHLVVALRPPGWRNKVKKSQYALSDYAFRIRVLASKSTLENAAEWAGFLRSNGKWMTVARGNNYDVREWSRDNMFILSGITDVGMHFKRGGYAGLGEGLRAFFFDGGRAAVLNAEDTAYRETFDRMVDSFRFDGTKATAKR